ncbi:hypothetical protein FHS27_006220 [Rhodopirellula rubra]|uniref:Uncharacterized protein n=1 Tax=Aporhodopirellula rubra TaxID=980271 RepID=A0A7W5E6B3_9BACT|nr:hypothetical protein [Aporhodopirellula rubra]MBB3210373.1 hypothetical protein [Aporhodopirellula rubra]
MSQKHDTAVLLRTRANDGVDANQYVEICDHHDGYVIESRFS